MNTIFFKPYRIKSDSHCQGYIHYSSRRHTQKKILGRKIVLTLLETFQIKKKKRNRIGTTYTLTTDISESNIFLCACRLFYFFFDGKT